MDWDFDSFALGVIGGAAAAVALFYWVIKSQPED